ncbi:hypothetical protein [Bacillus sp. FJAT-45037]|uniref:hypothetical protein n=1 Tax=Bacillus sp. FJAT-45037 TaxID=2011007 RepID=UPI000C24D2CA|nr:hypothetical protein [Bacillus sp. FJAT-45037]
MENVNFSKKIIGEYKSKAWAIKVFEKMELNEDSDGEVLVKAIFESSNNLFYPGFLAYAEVDLDTLKGVYMISESDDQFNLIPYELAKDYLKKDATTLEPFTYTTLS